MAGCVAYFPSDGARVPDYLVATDRPRRGRCWPPASPARAASRKLVRFNTQPDAESVPLSELAAVCLEAAGGRMRRALVIAGETAGLSGARLRRSPAASAAAAGSMCPAVRDWLSFAPERTYADDDRAHRRASWPGRRRAAGRSTSARSGDRSGSTATSTPPCSPTIPCPSAPWSSAPWRGDSSPTTSSATSCISLWDDRGEAGVGESALVRGVGWVAPITQIG